MGWSIWFSNSAGEINGAVVYDPKVYATSNVASTVAGVENLLPIRFDPVPDSLYSQLVTGGPKLAVKVWLVNADGSSRFTGRGTIPDWEPAIDWIGQVRRVSVDEDAVSRQRPVRRRVRGVLHRPILAEESAGDGAEPSLPDQS